MPTITGTASTAEAQQLLAADYAQILLIRLGIGSDDNGNSVAQKLAVEAPARNSTAAVVYNFGAAGRPETLDNTNGVSSLTANTGGGDLQVINGAGHSVSMIDNTAGPKGAVEYVGVTSATTLVMGTQTDTTTSHAYIAGGKYDSADQTNILVNGAAGHLNARDNQGNAHIKLIVSDQADLIYTGRDTDMTLGGAG